MYKMPALEVTPSILDALAAGAPIALGVSGGKDSTACALATMAYLNDMGHTGPRLLIHSDLGRVEWKDSLPTCQRLADYLGLELVVVKRQAGDMMDRWLQRWRNNWARYALLECVKLVLPWSTPAMRFCTSELKTDIICRELIRMFPLQTILSVVGIRREESTNRAQAPVCSVQNKLTNKKAGTNGYNWNPLLAWTLNDVLACHQAYNFPLHEAYRVFNSSRVSCAFCILGSKHDLLASAGCADNHDIYKEQVGLEIISAFSFQSGKWLGDVAPWLLDASTLVRLEEAKKKAKAREELESTLPRHLLYTKGWPTDVPTLEEAKLLSTVRKGVSAIMDLPIQYAEPDEITERYRELIAKKPVCAIR